jgi:hypothetical protein
MVLKEDAPHVQNPDVPMSLEVNVLKLIFNVIFKQKQCYGENAHIMARYDLGYNDRRSDIKRSLTNKQQPL